MASSPMDLPGIGNGRLLLSLSVGISRIPSMVAYVSFSLNSLKRVKYGYYTEEYYRGY